MKTTHKINKKEPVSQKRRYKFGELFIILLVIVTLNYNFINKYDRNITYKSLNMSFKSDSVFEYGTDVNVLALVNSVSNGTIKALNNTLDTSTLGKQEVEFELKDKSVKKTFKTEVEITDTKAPIIELKESTITIYKGNSYNFNDNIQSVYDEVDGDIPYSEENNDNTNYYTFVTDFNNNQLGNQNVTVVAYDKNGNKTESSFTIKVVQKVYTYRSTGYVPTSVDTSSVVSTALSFVGARYVYGGASPERGFDCSGFVQYVFKLHGKSMGHGATIQSRVGVSVGEAGMQAGDIIIWSDTPGRITHVGIYIGNGMFVHAANEKRGVEVQSVSTWKSWGSSIVDVRRV